MKNLRIRLLIALVISLALSILPLPEFISLFRPPWVLLLVLYIEYFVRGNFTLFSLLLIGLTLDSLLATVIGEHAFALILVTWIASSKSRRFQFFSMMQQICLIGLFCFTYQGIISFIDALLGLHYSLLAPLSSGLLSMFVWPWLRLLGDDTLRSRLAYR